MPVKKMWLWPACWFLFLSLYAQQKSHTAYVNAVVLLPGAKSFLSASDDSTVRQWELASGKLLKTFKGHSAAVTQLVLLPDGKTFLSAGTAEAIHWELATGRKLHSFPGYFNCIALSPDKKGFLGERIGGLNIFYWDVISGKMLRKFSLLRGNAWDIRFLPDNKTFLVNTNDYSTPQYDLASGRLIRTHKGYVNEILSAGKTLLISGINTFFLKEISSGKILHSFKGHQDGWRTLRLAGGRTFLATPNYTPIAKEKMPVEEDFAILHWEASSGKLLQTFKGHQDAVTQLLPLRNGKGLLTASKDRTVRYWDMVSGKLLKLFKGHGNDVAALALLPDGKSFLSATGLINTSNNPENNDHQIRLWDLASGQLLKTFSGHTAGVGRLMVLPDGKSFLSWAGLYDNQRLIEDFDKPDHHIRHWDLRTGQLLHTF